MKTVNTLIVIVAFAVIGLIGYALVGERMGIPLGSNVIPSYEQNATPTATTTSHNQNQISTYTNQKYALSIQYPATYEVAVPTVHTSSTTVVVLQTKSKDTLGTPNHRFSVSLISSKVFTEESTELKNLLMNSTVFDASGLNPESFSAFTKRTVGKNTYYFIPTGRFEGVLTFDYYLVTPRGVFKFVSVSQGVDWTNPALDTEGDTGHVAARSLLSTVEVK